MIGQVGDNATIMERDIFLKPKVVRKVDLVEQLAKGALTVSQAVIPRLGSRSDGEKNSRRAEGGIACR